MRSWIAFAALLSLSACGNHLAELKAIPLAGDDFSSLLAKEYRDYADSESEQGRLIEAERFAEKGLMAARNQPPLPDEPSPDYPKLAQARGELAALLTAENKNYDPANLARVQVLFDCWISEEKRGHQQESDACAAEFRAAIDRLKEELG